MISMRVLWLEMKDMLRLARRVINGRLGHLGLTSAEGDILYYALAGGEPYRQDDLASILDVGKAAVSRAVDSLESKGYVRRSRLESDGRSRAIVPTDKADAIRGELEAVYGELYRAACGGIPEADVALVASMLGKVAANLKSLEAR